MADQKVSDLPSLNGADVDAADLLYIVDSSAGAAGSKKITIGQYQLAPVSGGTANTVVYLNGSKVESSSSALTFDGTNFATTGTSSAAKLIPTGGTATGNGMYLPAANTLAWSNNGAETMRLDSSGNLGIGTSSPGYKLDIHGASGVGVQIYETSTGNNNRLQITQSATVSTYNNTYSTGSGSHAWQIGNVEFMRLDSSGNLGLGVTPSAWGAGFKAAQVDSQSAITGSGANTYLSTNWFYTTSDRYIANGFATLYRQNAGQHIFYTAPSGTAGNAISFTQAMTLDASGNLSVGATTTSGNGERLYITNANNVVAVFKGTGSGLAEIRTVNDANKGVIVGSYASTYSGGSNFSVGANGCYVSSSSSGAPFGIGTGDSQPLLLGTNNTERARITSGGDLLVGTTTSRGTITVEGSGAVLGLLNTNVTSTGATRYHAVWYENGTERGSVTSNGTSTAYNTSSDRRLKENIQSADDAGSVIDAIQVVKHDWKAGGHTRYGMIAQDLNAVAPEAVSAGDDGDEIERTWGVDYSKLVPMLIKEIQSLRARVAALEAK